MICMYSIIHFSLCIGARPIFCVWDYRATRYFGIMLSFQRIFDYLRQRIVVVRGEKSVSVGIFRRHIADREKRLRHFSVAENIIFTDYRMYEHRHFLRS